MSSRSVNLVFMMFHEGAFSSNSSSRLPIYIPSFKFSPEFWSPFLYIFFLLQVCLPCSVNYDAVIKLETLSEDSQWIFNQLNLTTWRQDWQMVTGTDGTGAHVGPGGRGGSKPTSNLALQYFKTISKDKVLELYKKYEDDFRLFDYSLGEFYY